MIRTRLRLVTQVTGLAVMVIVAAAAVDQAQGTACLNSGRTQILCPLNGAPVCLGADDCASATGWANQYTNVWNKTGGFVYRQFYQPCADNYGGVAATCYELYHCILNPATGDCEVDTTRKIQNTQSTAYPDVHC
jgi:hypothetical protein